MKWIANHHSRFAKTLLAFAAMSIAAVSATASAQTLGFTVTLLPTSPTTLEPVVVRISNPQFCTDDTQKARIQQTGMSIRIDIFPRDNCVQAGGPESHDIFIGRFPSGAFNLVVYYGGNMQVASMPFTVTDSYPSKAGPFPIDDYTDHWWDPQELGWGISIMQHTSDRIVATWFVYDQAGHPVWYSLQPGQWTFNYPVAVYTGPIYKTTGPYFGAPFDFSKLSITQVGTGALTFTDHNNGTFAYTIEGSLDDQSAEKAITRLSF